MFHSVRKVLLNFMMIFTNIDENVEVKTVKKQVEKKQDKTKNNHENDFEYQAADVDKVKETNVLFFEGEQLAFILRDQTLEKLFLSLCNLCSFCVGTSVTPL